MRAPLRASAYALGLLFVALGGCAAGAGPGGGLPFTHVLVDAENPRDPHAKTIGDIDGDGFADLLAASSAGEGLYWYRHPRWTKHKIAPGSFTTDMQVADIDRDRDLDVVIPTGSGIVWFRNPRPAGNPRAAWRMFTIGSEGADSHDVEVGDVNRDGKLDVVTRRKGGRATVLWLQRTPVSWRKIVVTTRAGEGTALGDLDGDGDLDVAQNGFWVETPKNMRGGRWIEHLIASNWPPDVGVHIADLNRDGRKDVVLAASESDGRLSWYEARNPKRGPWREHVVDRDVSYVHTFKTADVDRDGDLDLVTAEMHQSADPDEVSVYLNEGRGTRWTQEVLAETGSHNIRVGDIDRDGDVDVYGANWNDAAPNGAVIELWRNDLPRRGRLNRWRRTVVDAARPWRSIFIDAADLDGDRKPDIVTGGWWYRNPGAGGSWKRRTIGAPLNNMAAVLDVDGDGDKDVLGTEGKGSDANARFVWARNDGSGSFRILRNVPTGTGDFLQGVAGTRFSRGRPLEIALAWHRSGEGVQMLTVPRRPLARWNARRISAVSQDEALSAGDIDRDGDRDLLLGTKWLRNDGRSWTPFTLFGTSAAPDRNRLADVDGDGRLDAVVGFEAISAPGKLAWYRQPSSPTADWSEHVIATVVGPMSLDVADMDGDGDRDVVVGEHNLADPDQARLLVFENADGKGRRWAEHLVSRGDEHHDGARVVDIDRDGDLDIVSIGWGHTKVLLYVNEAPRRAGSAQR